MHPLTDPLGIYVLYSIVTALMAIRIKECTDWRYFLHLIAVTVALSVCILWYVLYSMHVLPCLLTLHTAYCINNLSNN